MPYMAYTAWHTAKIGIDIRRSVTMPPPSEEGPRLSLRSSRSSVKKKNSWNGKFVKNTSPKLNVDNIQRLENTALSLIPVLWNHLTKVKAVSPLGNILAGNVDHLIKICWSSEQFFGNLAAGWIFFANLSTHSLPLQGALLQLLLVWNMYLATSGSTTWGCTKQV